MLKLTFFKKITREGFITFSSHTFQYLTTNDAENTIKFFLKQEHLRQQVNFIPIALASAFCSPDNSASLFKYRSAP